MRAMICLVSIGAALLPAAGLADPACSVIDSGGRTNDDGNVFLLGEFAVGASSRSSVSVEHGALACLAEMATGCPGDADGDGNVDISDVGLLLSNFGASGSGLGGDLDNDGDVDISDLGLLLSQFGVTC